MYCEMLSCFETRWIVQYQTFRYLIQWSYLCKVMAHYPSGAGLSTVIMSFLLTTYYNVIMSWALFYLIYSFSPSLPWEVG